MGQILEVKGLCTEIKTRQGKVQALDHIDFTIEEGETLGIVGESGCGKSITALSVMNLLPRGIGKVVSGQILLEGEQINGMSSRRQNELRGDKIAMIFQEPMTSFDPVKKIGVQMQEILHKHRKISKKDAEQQVIQKLTEVGISRPQELIYNYPHELSGGMLQRVMIAMMLLCNPRLLILDEPTTALDVTIQAQILRLLENLKKEYGTSMMLITHNLGVVAEVCDRVIVMYAGQVVEEATVETLFDDPRHPYTEGLMKCAPRLTEVRDRLPSIEGMVPPIAEYPEGCRFAARCPYASEYCFEHTPQLYEIENGHKCRCHLYRDQK